MRPIITAAVLAGLTGPLAIAPLRADEIPATSRADAVTVFPNGAEVSRIAKVTLPKGSHTVVLSDLPADAIASSIRVEGLATGKLEIGSVDSRRLMVPRTDARASESERRRIEDEIERLRDERSVPEAELQAAETQRLLISNLAQLPVRPPAPQGNERQEDWSSVLAMIASGSADVQRKALDAQVKVRALDRQIEDLERKLSSIAPEEVERTEVRVHLEAMVPLEADLVLRYQVRNASWTPLYDARLATGDKTSSPALTLVRRAEIRQSTGEAWDNVALSLSTTRPNDSASIPDLRPVTVDFEQPPEMRPMASAPAAGMERGVSKQAMKSSDASEMSGADYAEAEPTVVAAAVAERQANVAIAPFQATFAVAGRTGVANTGEPKRVQLLSEDIEPVLSIRTVPRVDANAYLYGKMIVPQGTPLMPGPLSLFRDGTFVGTGMLPLLSPGEEHQLGFGIDDLVRVKHATLEEKRGETGLISTSRTDVRNFKITVKNLHERAMPVTVIDQVPVSNNQDIKVELTGKTPPTVTNVEDKRGILAWDFTIEPEQEQVLEFGYRVVWPSARTITYR